MITLIAAHDRNRAIGKDGDIPWHLPEDLAMFKRETLGGALIMGRRTWESLPFKPLPKRLNIVVSRDTSLHEQVVGSVEEAIALAQSLGYFRVYGIGGQKIYEAMLPLAHRLLITEVDLEVEGADAWFPEIGSGWAEIDKWTAATNKPLFSASELVALNHRKNANWRKEGYRSSIYP